MKRADEKKEKMQILQFDTICPILQDVKMLARYHKYNALIVPTLYHDPEGIHGVSHVRRTLLLALLMSYLDKLSDQQAGILAYASVYHDIGRGHDSKDDDHGYHSYQKATEQGLLSRLSDKEVRIVKELIERHAIDDSLAFSLETVAEDIRDEVRLLLRYFKDSDNLDRVRIHDLNVDYLRTEIARQMPLVAQQLLEEFSGIIQKMGSA
ncbi:MAG: metal dependent phosphohydrolase [Firmicutes bacterium]|nr:metal dependent phosphohydrolase [Bacillota bacterium]